MHRIINLLRNPPPLPRQFYLFIIVVHFVKLQFIHWRIETRLWKLQNVGCIWYFVTICYCTIYFRLWIFYTLPYNRKISCILKLVHAKYLFCLFSTQYYPLATFLLFVFFTQSVITKVNTYDGEQKSLWKLDTFLCDWCCNLHNVISVVCWLLLITLDEYLTREKLIILQLRYMKSVFFFCY